MCEYGNIEARSCNQFHGGRAISTTHSECVFIVLGTQREMRMRRIILSSVTSPALLYFPKLSHKRRDFQKKKK